MQVQGTTEEACPWSLGSMGRSQLQYQILQVVKVSSYSDPWTSSWIKDRVQPSEKWLIGRGYPREWWVCVQGWEMPVKDVSLTVLHLTVELSFWLSIFWINSWLLGRWNGNMYHDIVFWHTSERIKILSLDIQEGTGKSSSKAKLSQFGNRKDKICWIVQSSLACKKSFDGQWHWVPLLETMHS